MEKGMTTETTHMTERLARFEQIAARVTDEMLASVEFHAGAGLDVLRDLRALVGGGE